MNYVDILRKDERIDYLKNVKATDSDILTKKQSKQNKPKKVKILKIVMWVFLVLIFAFFSAVPPLIMNDQVNKHVDFKETHTAKEYGIVSEKLTLTTEDKLNIVAHEVYTLDPKAVIIFLSGIHNPSVTGFFSHAKILQENKYASILLEMRSHGESEGDVICLGYKEYLDTKAVVDYIKQNDKYKDSPIIVFGVSMGGATAINSIGEIEEIDGLISLSAYSSWEDVFYDNMIMMEAPEIYAKIQKPFVKLYTTFKYGFKSFNITPKNEIKKIGDRPALIMHSTEDSQVPYVNFQRIMKNAPEHVETWSREGDLHFIMKENDYLNPQDDKEYMKRILTFLNKHFDR